MIKKSLLVLFLMVAYLPIVIDGSYKAFLSTQDQRIFDSLFWLSVGIMFYLITFFNGSFDWFYEKQLGIVKKAFSKPNWRLLIIFFLGSILVRVLVDFLLAVTTVSSVVPGWLENIHSKYLEFWKEISFGG